MFKPTIFPLLAVAAGLLLLPAAASQTYGANLSPVLSGAYVANYNRYCQPLVEVSYDEATSTNVLIIPPYTYYGNAAGSVVSMNFNPGIMTAKLTGSENGGSVAKVTDENNVVFGKALKNTAVDTSVPYSNTISTLTLNGATLHAVYGAKKKGVAQSVAATGVDGNGCSINVYAVK
jgi:hypothetical protein